MIGFEESLSGTKLDSLSSPLTETLTVFLSETFNETLLSDILSETLSETLLLVSESFSLLGKLISSSSV